MSAEVLAGVFSGSVGEIDAARKALFAVRLKAINQMAEQIVENGYTSQAEYFMFAMHGLIATEHILANSKTARILGYHHRLQGWFNRQDRYEVFDEARTELTSPDHTLYALGDTANPEDESCNPIVYRVTAESDPVTHHRVYVGKIIVPSVLQLTGDVRDVQVGVSKVGKAELTLATFRRDDYFSVSRPNSDTSIPQLPNLRWNDEIIAGCKNPVEKAKLSDGLDTAKLIFAEALRARSLDRLH